MKYIVDIKCDIEGDYDIVGKYEERCVVNRMSDLMTFTINDADLDKLSEILKDINVKECPWFEIQDKHGVKAKYYRESHWIPCSERLPEEDHWLGGSGRQFSDNVLISILNSADEDEWVDVSYTIDGEWTLELSRDCKVIAWKPLPSPYGEEADE